jgi:aarF domain-containing kinase
MKGFNLSPALRTSNPWTCTRCLHQAQGGLRTLKQVKEYSTRTNKIPRPRRRGRVLLAATGGALGLGAISFTDDVKHAYEAVERTGRVVSTLALCINEYGFSNSLAYLIRQKQWLTVCSYRVTLNYNEKLDDQEEQAKLLKDCHQRCADRTLKVLEKNGSIFIKLGQHLVR